MIVTEQDWFTETDLVEMLAFLGQEASQRKLRLFAVLCCGWATQLGPSMPFLDLLNVAERFADGTATVDELTEANEASNVVYQECEEALSVAASHAVLTDTSGQGDDPTLTQLRDAADIVSQTTEAVVDGSHFAYTARGCGQRYTHSDSTVWLRDIFGNPFRPTVVNPSWLTPDIRTLAEGIYQDRAFDRMPILADALQDAGCDNDDILSHCRSDAQHVRGCWVVDLLLGKS